MFLQIQDDLLFVKNGDDKVYEPTRDNEIGNWNHREGYQVVLKNPVNWVIGGNSVNPETSPINLTEGLNLIAYLLPHSMNISTALSSIHHKLTLVSDTNGNVYWPAKGINTIGDMKPGYGYRIRVSDDITLIYPSLTE